MKKLIPVFAALLLLCACAAADAEPPPAPVPSPDTAPSAAPEPLITGSAGDVKLATLTVDGAAYALSAEETARICALLSPADTQPSSGPERGECKYTLAFLYASGREETVRSNGTGEVFYRFTGGEDGGDCVLTHSAALGELLAETCARITAPEIDLGAAVRGEVERRAWNGSAAYAEITLLDDTVRRFAELGELVPYTADEFELRSGQAFGGPDRIVRLFGEDGGELIAVVGNSSWYYVLIGGHPYRLGAEDADEKLEELVRFAPQTVFVDENDLSEYVFANGLRINLSYGEVAEIMGPPDHTELCWTDSINGGFYHYSLYYGNHAVLTLTGGLDGSGGPLPVEDTSVSVIQLLAPGIETARGITPGDSAREIAAAYGEQDISSPGGLGFYYADRYLTDALTDYDGSFSLGAFSEEHWADDRESNPPIMFFLFTRGELSSILLRPSGDIPTYWPLFPPAGAEAPPVRANALFGEKEVAYVSEYRRDGSYEVGSEYSARQTAILSEVLASTEISRAGELPDEAFDDLGSKFLLTVTYTDGTSAEIISAMNGEMLCRADGDGYIIARDQEIRSFLWLRYVWSDYQLGLWK